MIRLWRHPFIDAKRKLKVESTSNTSSTLAYFSILERRNLYSGEHLDNFVSAVACKGYTLPKVFKVFRNQCVITTQAQYDRVVFLFKADSI